jgi:hypothetical protein
MSAAEALPLAKAERRSVGSRAIVLEPVDGGIRGAAHHHRPRAHLPLIAP